MKIANDEFNRELSRYISTRRNMGKPFHVQITDFIKETRRSLSNVSKTKEEETLEENEAVEIEVERPEELAEEYEELEKAEDDIRKEKKSFWNFFTDAFRTKMEEDEGMEPEELKEEAEEFEDEYQGLEGMEEEIEERKEGIFNKIARFFSTEKNEPEIIEEVAEEFTLNEDIREAFKVLTKWLEKLPEKELNKFKESEDFEKYKAVLRKYNMIR